MAKFNKKHGKSSRGNAFLGRAVWTTILLIALMVYLFMKMAGVFGASDNSDSPLKLPDPEVSYDPDYKSETTIRNFYAKGSDGQIVDHKYYSLAYNEDYEQADWVAYKLTRNSLAAPNVDRQRRFNADPDVKTKSAVHSDYSNSGYTRGHMAPAGDMAFSKEAMKETFYMSNMSPQSKELNAGIWNQLEMSVRDWAFKEKEIYVTTGPVFYDNNPEMIGKKNKVAVPDAFYKAILDYEGAEKKGIGFLIPHDFEDDQIHTYAVSIEELEEIVGLDFFSDVYQDNDEQEIESKFKTKKWKISSKRYN